MYFGRVALALTLTLSVPGLARPALAAQHPVSVAYGTEASNEGDPNVSYPIRTRRGEGRENTYDARLLLRDVNARRSAVGAAPLQMDGRLCAVARAHALDMVGRGYFAHDTPEGVDPFARMQRAGVRFGYAGENLAMDRDEEAAELALYRSPGHRENTLDVHFRRVGIAAYSTSIGVVFVEEFSD